MSNLVIVAIPDENDRVWKVSSEKKPHLTLLFLGDEANVNNTDQIVQFVEHATDQMLRRFYLTVDRRDVLGDEEADVLFFKRDRWDFKAVWDFRTALLQDSNIRSAYDGATQFDGPWKPHLTLGYPGSPAKPDDTDRDFGFYDVSFNKIGVWMGDYEGPEFVIKDRWDEFDAAEVSPMAVAMGDIPIAELEHYGVKGMKWGVRKAADAAFRTAPHAPYSSIVLRQVVASKAKKGLKGDLPAIKAKHGDYAKMSKRAANPLSKEAKAYRNDVKASYIKHLEASANSMTNKSGTRQYTTTKQFTLKEKGAPNKSTYYWYLKSRDIAHADDDLEFTVQPKIVDGYIVDVELVTDEAAQSMELGEAFIAGLDDNEGIDHVLDLGEQFLEHYGVKGMRWGQRKASPTAVDPTATSVVPHGAKRKTKIKVDGGENHSAAPEAIKAAETKQKLKRSGMAALSNKELQELQTRANLERNVAQLVGPQTATAKGQRFVRGLIGLNKQVNDAANTALTTKRLADSLR